MARQKPVDSASAVKIRHVVSERPIGDGAALVFSILSEKIYKARKILLDL
jgi:hypothetical protein